MKRTNPQQLTHTLSLAFFLLYTDKDGVALNKSGCGDVGLLDFFQNYWKNNRASVSRDAAQLFSGTGLECAGDSCTIGCAITGGACDNDSGYGVNYVTYDDNVAMQALLVSHELGHNLNGKPLLFVIRDLPSLIGKMC